MLPGRQTIGRPVRPSGLRVFSKRWKEQGALPITGFDLVSLFHTAPGFDGLRNMQMRLQTQLAASKPAQKSFVLCCNLSSSRIPGAAAVDVPFTLLALAHLQVTQCSCRTILSLVRIRGGQMPCHIPDTGRVGAVKSQEGFAVGSRVGPDMAMGALHGGRAALTIANLLRPAELPCPWKVSRSTILLGSGTTVADCLKANPPPTPCR